MKGHSGTAQLRHRAVDDGTAAVEYVYSESHSLKDQFRSIIAVQVDSKAIH